MKLHSRYTPKISRKGNCPSPKGSIDPPHRQRLDRLSPICKPERELHRFRKEDWILRTETFGSPFRQLANPRGNCIASERKPRSSAQKRLDRLLLTCKPERELPRFRKEALILRTGTCGLSHAILSWRSPGLSLNREVCPPTRELCPNDTRVVSIDTRAVYPDTKTVSSDTRAMSAT